MKIRLLFKRPQKRTGDHFLKLLSLGRARGSEKQIKIYAFRLIPYSAFVALFAYLGLSLALTFWINREGFSTVSYCEVLKLPFSWEEYQKHRGDDYIRSGMEDLETGKLKEGIMKIRTGLGKNPENIEGRMFIARLFYSSGRLHQVSYTLEKGIELGLDDQSLLKTYFSVCRQSDQLEDVIRVCRDFLSPGKTLTEDKRVFFELHLARALKDTGQWEALLELAHTVNSRPNQTFRLVDAEFYALFNLGRFDEARALLQHWNRRVSADPNLRFLMVDLYMENGEDEQVKANCDRFLHSNILDPRKHIQVIGKLHEASLFDSEKEAIDRFFTFFGENEEGLKQLLNYAGEQKNVLLAERIITWVRAQYLEDHDFILKLLYIYLPEGRWTDAQALLEEITSRIEEYQPRDQHLIHIADLIVDLRTDKRASARPQIINAVQRLRASISFYLMLNEILISCHLEEEAAMIMNQAIGIFPDSDRIQRAQKQTAQFLKERKELQEQSENKPVLGFESPYGLIDELDQYITNKDYRSAEDLLLSIGQAKPDWWSESRDDFEYRRLMIYMETRDSTVQANSTTLFLENHPEQSDRLLRLSRQYHRDGQEDEARLIVEQVLGSDPENTEAATLYQEITNKKYETPTGSEDQAILVHLAYQERNYAIDELRAAVDSEDWDQAKTTVQRILEANPMWLRGDRKEFDLLKLQLSLELGNFSQAETLMRLYMGGDYYSARELLDFARKCREAGKGKIADLVETKVFESFPELEEEG